MLKTVPGLHSETLFHTARQNCHFGAGATDVWQSACLAFMKCVVHKPHIKKNFTFIPEYHKMNRPPPDFPCSPALRHQSYCTAEKGSLDQQGLNKGTG